MNDLKPCPFCGCHAEISKTRLNLSASVLYTVSCTNKKDCFRAEFSSFTEETAIKYWNTRAIEDAKDKEIERLKAIIDELTKPRTDSIKKAVDNARIEIALGNVTKTGRKAVHDAPEV